MKWLGKLRSRGWERRLARLNHILIPDSASERDRLRDKRWVKVLGVTAVVFHGFTREGRALLLLSLPVGLAGLDVRFSQVYLLSAMIGGLLIGSWLSRPFFRLRGLRSHVLAPARVAAGSPAHFQVELTNTNKTALHNLEVVLPFLPWDGRWSHPGEGVATLSPGTRTAVTAQATFAARGEHHLDPFQIGRVLPLGLSRGRLVNSDGARFLVVPRLANVTRVFAEAQHPLGHGAVSSARHHGEQDFASVRPYRVGDPLKHLHARTWARTGQPHVREFVDERDERIALVLRLEGGLNFEIASEAALSLAAGIASRLALHGAGLDTLVCDETRFAITPRQGPSALDRVLDHLATHTPGSRDGTAALVAERALRGATSAVLVTTGDPKVHEEMIRRLLSNNVPVRWLFVADDDEVDVPAGAQLVRVQAIDQGEAIEA